MQSQWGRYNWESKRFYQDDSQTESELWGWRMKASVGFGRWEKFRQARGVTAAAGGFPEAVSVLQREAKPLPAAFKRHW